MEKQVVWFTTILGGALGVHKDNIKSVCTKTVRLMNGTVYQLDESKFSDHWLRLLHACRS